MDAHTPEGGTVVGMIPQIPHTYRYFWSLLLCEREGRSDGRGHPVYRNRSREGYLHRHGPRERGIIDRWTAQDIALERAATAREAVKIMGELVEQYGWSGPGDINVADGNRCGSLSSTAATCGQQSASPTTTSSWRPTGLVSAKSI